MQAAVSTAFKPGRKIRFSSMSGCCTGIKASGPVRSKACSRNVDSWFITSGSNRFPSGVDSSQAFDERGVFQPAAAANQDVTHYRLVARAVQVTAFPGCVFT